MTGPENALRTCSVAELAEKERLARTAMASIQATLKSMPPWDDDRKAKKDRVLELQAEISAIRSERARRS
jgi:hypothetical protein